MGYIWDAFLATVKPYGAVYRELAASVKVPYDKHLINLEDPPLSSHPEIVGAVTNTLGTDRVAIRKICKTSAFPWDPKGVASWGREMFVIMLRDGLDKNIGGIEVYPTRVQR